jgi:hypothetical protein
VLYGLSHLVYLPHSQRVQFPLFHDAYFQRPNEVSRVFPLTSLQFFLSRPRNHAFGRFHFGVDPIKKVLPIS